MIKIKKYLHKNENLKARRNWIVAFDFDKELFNEIMILRKVYKDFISKKIKRDIYFEELNKFLKNKPFWAAQVLKNLVQFYNFDCSLAIRINDYICLMPNNDVVNLTNYYLNNNYKIFEKKCDK